MGANSIGLLEESLRLSPDVQIVPRDLIIPPDVPEEALPAIGNRILAVRGFSKWALGAVLNQMRLRRPIMRDGRPTNEYDQRWANDYAEAMSLDSKERRAIMATYVFYPPQSRTANLCWECYFEAMIGVADGRPNGLARALAYLTLAEKDKLGTTGLRKLIRTQQATEHADTTIVQEELLEYHHVIDFDRWCSKERARLSTYNCDKARATLNDLTNAIAFVSELRAIVDSVKI